MPVKINSLSIRYNQKGCEGARTTDQLPNALTHLKCFKPIRLGISCGYKNTSYFPRHKKKHISQKAANTRKILVSLHKCAHWSITFWETRRSSSYFLVYEVALCSVCTTWGEIPIRWCKKNSSIKFSLSTISRFQYIKLLRLLLNIRKEEHVF